MIIALLILITILAIVFLIRKWMDKPYYIINCHVCNVTMRMKFDPGSWPLPCKDCAELVKNYKIKTKDYAPTKKV